MLTLYVVRLYQCFNYSFSFYVCLEIIVCESLLLLSTSSTTVCNGNGKCNDHQQSQPMHYQLCYARVVKDLQIWKWNTYLYLPVFLQAIWCRGVLKGSPWTRSHLILCVRLQSSLDMSRSWNVHTSATPSRYVCVLFGNHMSTAQFAEIVPQQHNIFVKAPATVDQLRASLCHVWSSSLCGLSADTVRARYLILVLHGPIWLWTNVCICINCYSSLRASLLEVVPLTLIIDVTIKFASLANTCRLLSLLPLILQQLPMQSLYFPHTLLQPLFVCQCCELSFTIHTLVPCDSLMKVPFLLPVLFCSQHVLGAAHTTSELLSTTSQPLLFAVLSFSDFTLHYFFSFKAQLRHQIGLPYMSQLYCHTHTHSTVHCLV